MIIIGKANENIILNVIITEGKPTFLYTIYFIDVQTDAEPILFTAMSLISTNSNSDYFGEYDFTIYYIKI